MQDFRNLRVWHEAHQLALMTYRLTDQFPASERFGLTSQMRRAAVSISSNIAEGCGRDTTADFKRFLTMSMGSASELEYQFLLARDLSILGGADHQIAADQTIKVKKMLSRLIGSLRN